MKFEVAGQVSPQMAKSVMSALTPAVASVEARTQRAATAVPAVAPVQAVGQVSQEDLSQAVNDINKSLQFLANGLVFSVDDSSKRQIVKVVDSHTNEVIRQFPTEQALQLAKVLDQVLGKLLNEKA